MRKYGAKAIERDALLVSNRVANHIERDTTRELLNWAIQARDEMKAFHSLAYDKCEGGCPTSQIIDGLSKAIAKAQG